MIIKDIHENLLTGIQTMLVNPLIDLPYYGEFNLHVNFSESKSISTCAVNVTSKGMNFYYSSEFLEKLTQKEINFIILHEDFHLLFDHPSRTVSGNYKHELSNIVQDMIINHVIWEDISHDFVEIPKGEDGKNMALFVPKEYTGKLIFEELYEFMSDKKDEHDRKKKQKSEDKQKSEQDGDQGSGQGSGQNQESQDGGGQPSQGQGKGQPSQGQGKGQPSDEYGPYGQGSAESTLNKLVKKRKDYLKKIKRTISNVIFGSNKVKSITKRNRRDIEGIKGKRKIKSIINVGLDTSGSMGGTFERVLSYIYQNDIEVNFMESDTEVRWVKKLKSKKDIEAIPIKGLGGTCLQPMIDHIASNFNNLGTVLLTDGYTDSLDFSKIKGKTLILSVGVKCPISHDNGRVTQIVLEK